MSTGIRRHFLIPAAYTGSAFLDRTDRALCCTCTTAYTCILVDLKFAVAFRNGSYRTLSRTGTA